MKKLKAQMVASGFLRLEHSSLPISYFLSFYFPSSFFKMSSYSSKPVTTASASEEDGWIRVGRGGSTFSGDAASAFSRTPRRVAEDSTSAFGKRSSYRPNSSSSAFDENAAAAFGRARSGGGRPRTEFDDAASSAFGGGGGRRRDDFEENASRVFGSKKSREDNSFSRSSRYGVAATAAARPPPPLKKQTFDEAFPMLGEGAAPAPAPVTAETTERAPTLAEKLRKKVAEEAAEDERRAKLAEAAVTRRAIEARERAVFATLGASRAATQVRYSDECDDDAPPANYEDDLDCGAFGESVEPRGGAYKASAYSKYDHDYEGYGEGGDDY